MNPALWLDRTARLHPSSPALFDGTQQIANYATFAHQAAALASSLIDGYAVRPGERVALFMANRPEYLVSLYAIWWAGAVPVPVNAKLHPNEAAWILSNCRPKVLIGTGIAFSAVRQSLADEHMAAIDVSSDAYRTALAAQPRLEPTERSIDDLAWLFYTSGTTGRPKGAMITCGNILAMTQSYFADVDAVEEGDATLYAAPISHGAGLYNFMFVIRAVGTYSRRRAASIRQRSLTSCPGCGVSACSQRRPWFDGLSQRPHHAATTATGSAPLSMAGDQCTCQTSCRP